MRPSPAVISRFSGAGLAAGLTALIAPGVFVVEAVCSRAVTLAIGVSANVLGCYASSAGPDGA